MQSSRVINLNEIRKSLDLFTPEKSKQEKVVLGAISSHVSALDKQFSQILKIGAPKLSNDVDMLYPELEASFKEQYKTYTEELASLGRALQNGLKISAELSDDVQTKLREAGSDLIRLSEFVPEFRFSPDAIRMNNLCTFLGGFCIRIGQDMLPLGVVETPITSKDSDDSENSYESSNGECAGMQHAWVEEILKHGTPHYPIAANMTALQHQQRKRENIEKNYTQQGDGFNFEEADAKLILNQVEHNFPHLIVLFKPGGGGHAIGARRHPNFIEIFDPNFGYYFFSDESKAVVWFNVLLQLYHATDFPCDEIGILKYTTVDPNDIKPSSYPSKTELARVAFTPYGEEGYRALINGLQSHIHEVIRYAKKEKLLMILLKSFTDFAACAYEAEKQQLKTVLEALQGDSKQLDEQLITAYFKTSKLYKKVRDAFRDKTDGHANQLVNLMAKLDEQKSQNESMPRDMLDLINKISAAKKEYQLRLMDLAAQKREAEAAREMSKVTNIQYKLDILALKQSQLLKANIEAKLYAGHAEAIQYGMSEALQDYDAKVGYLLDPEQLQPHLNEMQLIDAAKARIEKYRAYLTRQFHAVEKECAAEQNVFPMLERAKKLCEINMKQDLAARKITALTQYAESVLSTPTQTAQDDIRNAEFDSIMKTDDDNIGMYFEEELSTRFNLAMSQEQTRQQQLCGLMSKLTARPGVSSQMSCAERLEKLSQHEAVSEVADKQFKSTLSRVVAMQTNLEYEIHNLSQEKRSVDDYTATLNSINADIGNIEQTLQRGELDATARQRDAAIVQQEQPPLSYQHSQILYRISSLIDKMNKSDYGNAGLKQIKIDHLKRLSEQISNDKNNDVVAVIKAFATDQVKADLSQQRRTTFFISLFNPRKTDSIKLLEKYTNPPAHKKRKRCCL